MKYKSMLYLSAMIIAGLFFLWGCPKKMEVASAPEANKEAVTSPSTPEAAPAPAAPEAKSEEPKERATVSEAGLKPIYFDFDKSFIRDDARPVMQANADWLKANPNVKIKIEGNCDERGTIEYNQALGQRRAASAKRYLTDLGVSAGRISLISYGKEKPVCTDHNETCWQKNRRDDLVESSR
jgi:peptidoglycan-associated lipoprotein